MPGLFEHCLYYVFLNLVRRAKLSKNIFYTLYLIYLDSLRVVGSCPMNLQYYPLDRQLCTLEFESYGFSTADIAYVWAKGQGSVGISSGLELPEFQVVGTKSSQKVEVLSTGKTF